MMSSASTKKALAGARKATPPLKGRKKTKQQKITVTKAPEKSPAALDVPQMPTETVADALAHVALLPTVQAAFTVMNIDRGFGELSLNTLIADLREQCNLAVSGNMVRAEGMLTAQAHTLDILFNNLTRRAALNMGHHIDATESYLKLALKAQGQCRATLETLSAIKNPPVIFAKQANITSGPQQVNNGAVHESESSRTKKTESTSNELSRLKHEAGQRMDIDTPAAAGAANSTVAAVDTIQRS